MLYKVWVRLECEYDDIEADSPEEAFHIASAKLLGEKFGFLEDCIRFIMDDDGSIGRENYAYWLNKREAKTNA